MDERLTHETTELLQQLIRNACVNDGTRDSGNESRSAEVLQTVLEGAGQTLRSRRHRLHPARHPGLPRRRRRGAGGVHGTEWLAEHHWDEVGCDDVLTETGGQL